MRNALVITFLLLALASQSFAQMTSVPKPAYFWSETQVPIRDSGEVHSPKKATIMSAIVPWLGQVYNKKYWKVGVIYGLGIGLGYGLKVTNDSLKGYQQSLTAELDEDSTTVNYLYPNLGVDKIRSERNYYRQTRDQLILGLAAVYALQIIDANVDAHLREFDINKDLALQIRPTYQASVVGITPMVGARLRLR